jgi:hypothetical protein
MTDQYVSDITYLKMSLTNRDEIIDELVTCKERVMKKLAGFGHLGKTPEDYGESESC